MSGSHAEEVREVREVLASMGYDEGGSVGALHVTALPEFATRVKLRYLEELHEGLDLRLYGAGRNGGKKGGAGQAAGGGGEGAYELNVRLLEKTLEAIAARKQVNLSNAGDNRGGLTGPSANPGGASASGSRKPAGNKKKRARKNFSPIGSFESRDEAVAYLREAERKKMGSFVRANSTKSYKGGPLGAVFECRLHHECKYSLRLFYCRETDKWNLGEDGTHADSYNILTKKISPALKQSLLSLMEARGDDAESPNSLAASCLKDLHDEAEREDNKEMLAMIEVSAGDHPPGTQASLSPCPKHTHAHPHTTHAFSLSLSLSLPFAQKAQDDGKL